MTGDVLSPDSTATPEACAAHAAHTEEPDARASARRLLAALCLTAGFMVVEAVGGFLFGSLALLSDAVHMLTDSTALGVALVAQRIACRPRSAARTYGHRRAETLAAFVNGLALGIGGIWIFVEAVGRWRTPHEVDGGGMLAVAVTGLAINLAAAYILWRGRTGQNVNTRAALFHVLSDAAGSVGAIAAAALVITQGWNRADTVISMVLAALILYGAYRLLSKTSSVLMEGTPPGVDLDHVETTVRGTDGVTDVHDLHVWTISDGFPVVTVHVVLDGSREACAVAQDVCARVAQDHGILHVTVQPELPS